MHSGAASSAEEAGEICRALLAASVVMRLGDLVYLRPYDVAELVVQVGGVRSFKAVQAGRLWPGKQLLARPRHALLRRHTTAVQLRLPWRKQ